MGKTYELFINRFDGSVATDPRDIDTRQATLIKNFDNQTYPHKLVPFRSSESGDSATATSQKQAFAIGFWNPSGTSNDEWKLFALGVKSGAGTAEILMKGLTTDGSNNLTGDGWDTPNNNQSSGGSTSFNLFVYYKKTGKFYGGAGSRYIWAFTPDGATAWDDTSADLTSYTNLSQGLVHSKDDILYVGVDNKIISKNGSGSWNTSALTLPTHLYITSICEYGNYLAIAAAPLAGFGKSVVYLWDRDSTLATLSESLDWGEGVLKVLEEVGGYLIGISYVGGSSTNFKPKIVFRYYAGGKPIIFKELISESTATSASSDLPIFKQKINNSLYFLMTLTINGTRLGGIWKISRTPNGFILVMDRPANNDYVWTNSDTLLGFFIVEDFAFLSYTLASTYYLDKTDDQANYNVSGTYETLKLGESYRKFKLIGAGVMTEFLPAAGQIILKYRKDEETSWTTIFTNTTDNSLYHESNNIESTGVTFPEFREIQFQILSTGGAVITGLWAQFEEVDRGKITKLLKAISKWFG